MRSYNYYNCLCLPSVAGFSYLLYACIVLSNDGSHIVHATIADLNCVSVKNSVKFVVRWKLLLLQKK
jgi:hypothetical protein